MLQFLADDTWSNQYTDTGWVGIVVTLLLVGFILFNIWRSNHSGKKGKDLYIRRIAGLNAIDEAVGRATEMGKPVLMVPGISDPVNAIVVQALNIFSYVTRMAAKFANPIIMCCFSASTYTVAQEVVRDVYQEEGLSDRFDPDSVRFISDRQFAFAAGVSGLILREQTAATFFMGEFYAEALIFAETANSVGAIQIASSTETTQTPFFIASCDYVLIGDEFYAASAYLTRQPVLVGSLVGQDWCKLLAIFAIIVGLLTNTYERSLHDGFLKVPQVTREKVDAHWKDVDKPRNITPKDTFMSHVFNPQDDPGLAKVIHREHFSADELPIKTGPGEGS